MHTEYPVTDDCSQRQVVKNICNCLKNFRTLPSLALVIEPIYFVRLHGFVVSPQQKEVVGVFDFISEQKAYALQRFFAPVHIVAQEQIILHVRSAYAFDQIE